MGLFRRVVKDGAKKALGSISTPFVVIDVETTGLSPKSDRILELALVEYTNGAISNQLVSLFNPDGPVGASDIHGITDQDVINAPRFAEKSEEIVRFIQGRTLVAHNARFDLAFLRNELAFAGFEIPWIPALCTFEASRYYFPNLERRKLSDCCHEAEIELTNAHSALGDAMATGLLIHHFFSSANLPRARREDVLLITNPTQIEINRIAARPFPKKKAPEVMAAIKRAKEQPKDRNTNKSYLALRNALRDTTISSVMEITVPIGIEQYLDKLTDFFEDGNITDQEQQALLEVSKTYDLQPVDQIKAHEIFLLALAFQAISDEKISVSERDELNHVASILGLSEKFSTQVIKEAKKIKDERISRELPSLPDDWNLGEPLRVGDKVVFTGCDPDVRATLESKSKKVGVAISSSVSSKTKLLVTDGSWVGNKANDAEKLGIRVVHPTEYKVLLKFIQAALDSQPSKRSMKSSQTGAEDLNPNEVRAWALSVGIPVSPKGRIHTDVYEKFKDREI
jgi:DNA polymerase-3 subunit epsilon